MSCGVGQRCRSDLALQWLCCRPATAAPIRPLAWELPCAAGVALQSKKKKEEEGLLSLIYIFILSAST